MSARPGGRFTNMRLFGFLTRHLKKGPAAPTELDEAVSAFQRKNGVRFKDAGLLRVALTHGSYVHEHPDTGLASMGRMELLGDSVLGLVVNEYLYAHFPSDEEGELTKMKSLLVSKAVLARRGRNIRLGSFLLLGEGEVDAGGRERTSIVADGYESVIGAIYLDQGLEGARKFIEDTLLGDARKILVDSKHINYKSLLQEQVQGELRVHPEYRVLSETGPEHEKMFTVVVAVRRKPLGRGTGASKKEAEQAAAREALAGLEQAGSRQDGEGGRGRDRNQGERREQARGQEGGRSRGRRRDWRRGRDGDRDRDRGRVENRDQNRDRGQVSDQTGNRPQRGVERPGTERPGTERPGVEKPGKERSGAEGSGTERSGTERRPGSGRRRPYRSRGPRRRRREKPAEPGPESGAQPKTGSGEHTRGRDQSRAGEQSRAGDESRAGEQTRTGEPTPKQSPTDDARQNPRDDVTRREGGATEPER